MDNVIQVEFKTIIAEASKAVLKVYSADPHKFSKRPCGTCSVVSDILNENWGCCKINGHKL